METPLTLTGNSRPEILSEMLSVFTPRSHDVLRIALGNGEEIARYHPESDTLTLQAGVTHEQVLVLLCKCLAQQGARCLDSYPRSSHL